MTWEHKQCNCLRIHKSKIQKKRKKHRVLVETIVKKLEMTIQIPGIWDWQHRKNKVSWYNLQITQLVRNPNMSLHFLTIIIPKRSITNLVTIFFTNRGTKTGLFLLFSYRKRRSFSIALASLTKSNSYPILNGINTGKLCFNTCNQIHISYPILRKSQFRNNAIPVSPFPWSQNRDQTWYLSFAYIKQRLASYGYRSSLNPEFRDVAPILDHNKLGFHDRN